MYIIPVMEVILTICYVEGVQELPYKLSIILKFIDLELYQK